jgi:soluble lytic murein transglycosylase-like protein
MIKKFSVLIAVCISIAIFAPDYGDAKAIPHQELSHVLPQTTPGWERAVLEAIPKVLDKYGENIKEAAQEYRIDPRLITAILIVESMGNPYAESSAGAKGCMQTLPSTDMVIGVSGNSFNCRTSIWKGTKYLAHLRDTYNFTPRYKAIAAYEKGPEGVRKYTKRDLAESDYLNKVAFVVEHLPENF